MKLFKPTKILVHNDFIIARSVLKKYKIPIDEIIYIEVKSVKSIFDEIGVFVESRVKIFFTDSIENFIQVTKALNFEKLFGEDWYARTEAGEHLCYRNQDRSSGDSVLN